MIFRLFGVGLRTNSRLGLRVIVLRVLMWPKPALRVHVPIYRIRFGLEVPKQRVCKSHSICYMSA